MNETENPLPEAPAELGGEPGKPGLETDLEPLEIPKYVRQLYAKPMKRFAVVLDEDSVRKLKILGNGNLSAGVRKAVAIL